ncbi:PD40 domain-containing protein [Granulicella arctica]|uniref:Tol biopolymer transport system component n=1 Tax=Granulicella arctica TaxID=940613 RepID=A0A7Y9THB1_9BACT|nr:PD40 domain-containing protein [Granulicella arctica]NYF80861.1 Tol biopolymer transport system component [Granulicella arctica]
MGYTGSKGSVADWKMDTVANLMKDFQIDRAYIEAELESILASALFKDSNRASALLHFIVKAALTGETDSLKETYLAVAVFGRDASYDPKLDPIVRVQAGRLRAKLAAYYDGPGSRSSLRIEIPKGSYKPQIIELEPEIPTNEEVVPSPPIEVVTAPQIEPFIRRRNVYGPWHFVTLFGVVFALVSGFLWLWIAKRNPSHAMQIQPVATALGRNRQASFSSDNHHFVLVWSDGTMAPNLYISDIDGTEKKAFTHGTDFSIRPAWSPDDRDIAFLRISQNTSEIVVKPVYGSSESVLGSIHTPVNLWTAGPSVSTYAPGPAWSRDGRSLIVTDDQDGKGFGLYVWSLAHGDRRRLTTPEGTSEDIFPAVSPDGSSVAFVRYTSSGSDDVFVTSFNGGPLTRLSFERRDIQGLTWTPDGNNLIFASNRSGEHRLWKLSKRGGEPIEVQTSGKDLTEPAISPDGRSLLYTETNLNTNIWQLSINRHGVGLATPIPWSNSTRRSGSPQYSPDGQRVVFLSDRSGDLHLWTAARDGSNARQLTHADDLSPGGPRWSPDGKQIAFYALVDQNKQLFVVDSESGSVSRFLKDRFDDRSPNWSNDGRSIYFNSNRDGSRGCWKLSLADGAVSKLTNRLCWDAFESPDNQFVYFTTDQPGIWRIATTGKTDQVVPSLKTVGVDRYFASTRKGLYFVDHQDLTKAIQRFDPKTGLVETVGHLQGDLLPWELGLSVSPDDATVLFTKADESMSEIDLVHNF